MDHPEHLLTEANHTALADLQGRVRRNCGQFTPIVAQCNLKPFRKAVIQSFTEHFGGRFLEVRAVNHEALSQTITAQMAGTKPDVIIVRGLAWVYPLERWLLELDRDLPNLQAQVETPVIFWMNNLITQRFHQLAPNLSPLSEQIQFQLSPNGFNRVVNHFADTLFAKILDTNINWYQEHADYIPETNSLLRVELISEQQCLIKRHGALDPELEANLEFVLGQETDYSTPPCRIHYENSLAKWRLADNPKREGVVLFYLGLGWRLHGARNQSRRQYSYERAAAYFAECVALFEKTDMPERASKYINFLAGVLQRLGLWDQLGEVISKALAYREQFPDNIMLARTHGFIAEREHAMGNHDAARKHALKALAILEDVLDEEEETETPSNRSIAYHRGWYLYSLAKSYAHANQADLSMEWLQIARSETKAEYEPELYMNILDALQRGFYTKGQYQTSFRYRTELKRVEREFGMAAFVGANRLHPYRKVIRLSAGAGDFQRAVAPELTASGRDRNLEILLTQLDKNRQPIILTGPSGVGKSSLIQAGLIPMMERRSIAGGTVKFGLCQCYLDWIGVLSGQLEVKPSGGPPTTNPEKAVITRLNEFSDTGHSTVLIFDQLEEFFFTQPDQAQRLYFFNFLDRVLEHPSARVLLCIRDDYLNRLEEWTGYEHIDPVRIQPFAPSEAAMVVRNITQRAQYSLDDDLLEAWILDLAAGDGQVLPIELQIMGAQMQAENIHTREQYLQHGPKHAYIQRWLRVAAEKCGGENIELAAQILYQLAQGEAGARHFKTSSGLQNTIQPGVESWSDEDRNFIVTLEILEKSGMVQLYPESPSYRYQLTHDYIAEFIRNQGHA